MGLNCKCKDTSKDIPNLTGIAKGLYTPSPQVFPQGTSFPNESYAFAEALPASLESHNMQKDCKVITKAKNDIP